MHRAQPKPAAAAAEERRSVDNVYQVKLASTPVSTQTCRSELPAPSPNLPIESPPECHTITSTTTKQIPVPNTLVPTTINSTTHTRTDTLLLTTTTTTSQPQQSNNNNNIDNSVERHSSSSSEATKKQSSAPSCSKLFAEMPGGSGCLFARNDHDSGFTVLNIPSVRVQTPPVKRRKLSKLDLAAMRRKMKRQRRRRDALERSLGLDEAIVLSDSSSSDAASLSDSEEGEEGAAAAVDLWIKSGPPCPPDFGREKVEFLEVVGLTTHSKTNDVELEKLERRKWEPTWTPPVDEVRIFPLNLPTPRQSPSVLEHLPDSQTKRRFFHLLGLRNVPPDVRQETETIWMKIVEERMRRGCPSALTEYSFKAQAQQQKQRLLIPTATRKMMKDEGGGACAADVGLGGFEFKMPIVHQVPKTQVAVLLVEKGRLGRPAKRKLKNAQVQTEGEGERAHAQWPGIEGVMESYLAYHKEVNDEVQALSKQPIKEEVIFNQFEIKYFQRRKREMHATLFLAKKEGKRIQKVIDQLTRIINAFR